MSLFFTLKNYLMIQRTRHFLNRRLSQATELYVRKVGVSIKGLLCIGNVINLNQLIIRQIQILFDCFSMEMNMC